MHVCIFVRRIKKKIEFFFNVPHSVASRLFECLPPFWVPPLRFCVRSPVGQFVFWFTICFSNPWAYSSPHTCTLRSKALTLPPTRPLPHTHTHSPTPTPTSTPSAPTRTRSNFARDKDSKYTMTMYDVLPGKHFIYLFFYIFRARQGQQVHNDHVRRPPWQILFLTCVNLFFQYQTRAAWQSRSVSSKPCSVHILKRQFPSTFTTQSPCREYCWASLSAWVLYCMKPLQRVFYYTKPR